jgi:ParB-like chromosome segregation protein Spo0J
MPTEPKDLISAEEIAAFVAHPIAEIFPMISNDELRELAEDIRKNGMLEPITLFEGKILDGRNRFNAAKLVGFPFRRIVKPKSLCSL